MNTNKSRSVGGNMKILDFKSVFLVIAGIGASQIGLADAGRTPGTAGVSSSGAATYSIPIWTPPGPNNLVPRISLDYNSQQGTGLLGVGWTLGGISKIERCGQTMAQDGAVREVHIDSQDRYCLDGVRLRLTSPSIGYGQPDSTYQTEVADFSEIKAIGTYVTGTPMRFERRTKDGLIYHYGPQPSAQNAPAPHRWKMDKVTDRNGNSYTIQYENISSQGQSRPWRIRWRPTAHGSSEYSYLMEFQYEQRPVNDQLGGYVGGYATYELLRLKRIRVKKVGTSGETVLRRYELDYGSETISYLSKLLSLTECADDTNDHCLSPTVFNYQPGTSNLAFHTFNTGATVSGGASGDFNGDGKQDLAFISSGQWRVLFGSNGAFAAPVTVTGLTAASSDVEVDRFLPGGRSSFLAIVGGTLTTFSATDANGDGAWEFTGGVSTGITWPGTYAPQAFDHNGDGLSDIVWTEFNGSASGGSTIRRVNTRLNTTAVGSAGATFGAIVNGVNYPAVPAGGGFVAGFQLPERTSKRSDINGDGKEDFLILVVGRNGTTINVYGVPVLAPNEVTPTSMWSTWISPTISAGDINGDGCTEISSGLVIKQFGCIAGYPGTMALPAGVTLGDILGWADWNSDGRTDLMVRSAGNIGFYPSTGSGFGSVTTFALSATNGTAFLDLDGDAIVDVARFNGSSLEYYTRGNSTGVPLHYLTSTPNLIYSVRDGHGIETHFDYVSTAQNSYLPGAAPSGTLVNIKEPMIVVGRVRRQDGTGGTYSEDYTYVGAKDDKDRTAFAGFEEMHVRDSRTNFTTKTYLEQAMPKAGMVWKKEVLQSNGRPVARTTMVNQAPNISTMPGNNQRYYQYSSRITEESFDLPGPVDGATPMTTVVVDNEDVDTTYGNIRRTTETITDGLSTPVPADGGIKAITTRQFAVANTSSWCIGLVIGSVVERLDSANDSVTTTASIVPDTGNCRATSKFVEDPQHKYYVETQLTYDDFGNADTVTVIGKDENGAMMAPRLTRMTWDATGTFLERLENAEGEVTTFSFNDLGLLERTTDPNNLVTSVSYDEFGRQEKITRPDLTSTEFAYADCAPSCLSGSEHRTTLTVRTFDRGSSDARTTAYTYLDRFDRPIVARRTLLDGKQQWLETRYNARGKIEREGLPCELTSASTSCASGTANWLEYRYDDFGRLIEAKRPSSGGGASPIHTYAYSGRTKTTTDPMLKSRTEHVGVTGKIRSSVDASSYTQFFAYNPAGSLISVTDSLSRTLHTAEYEYGATEFQVSRSNPAAGTVTQKFNSLGELATTLDSRQTLVDFDYDRVSRLERRREINNVNSQVENESVYTYGANPLEHNVGLLVTTSSSAGGNYVVTNTYDELARIRYQDYTIPGESSNYRYQYAYAFASGFLDTLTYPTNPHGSALVLKYEYANEALKSIKINGTSQTVWSSVNTNIRGQITKDNLAIGIYPGSELVKNQTFDAVTGWPRTYMAGTPATENLIQSGSASFDDNGNVTQRQNDKTLLTEDFYYDALDRLDYSQLSGQSGRNLDMRYNESGDILEKDQANVTDFLTNYSITYNRANYPTSIAAGSEQTSFNYGPNHERWRMVVVGSQTETTTYIGSLVEKVTVGSATRFRHYIPTPGGAVALYIQSSTSPTTSWKFMLPDHLGSTDAIVDGAAGPTLFSSFGAFGDRRSAATWSGGLAQSELAALEGVTRDGFTGQTMLGMTGLIHMNGRVYDSVTARFLSPDPIISDPLNTQDFNRYAYAWNNPLGVTDPTGFTEEYGCMETWQGCPPPWILDDCRMPQQPVPTIGFCNARAWTVFSFNPNGLPTTASWRWQKNVGGTGDSSNAMTLAEQDQSTRVVNVTTADALQSLVAGAVNGISDAAADTVNFVGAVLLSETGIRPNVGPWRPMEPKSRYFGREGEAIGEGLGAVKVTKVLSNKLKAPTPAAPLTGQIHHAVSKTVHKALEAHPNLKGLYTARDSRFVTQAKDLAAHNGYDTFHRNLDAEVAGWIRTNPSATQAQFETYLRGVYQRPEVLEKFPNGL